MELGGSCLCTIKYSTPKIYFYSIVQEQCKHIPQYVNATQRTLSARQKELKHKIQRVIHKQFWLFFKVGTALSML